MILPAPRNRAKVIKPRANRSWLRKWFISVSTTRKVFGSGACSGGWPHAVRASGGLAAQQTISLLVGGSGLTKWRTLKEAGRYRDAQPAERRQDIQQCRISIT